MNDNIIINHGIYNFDAYIRNTNPIIYLPLPQKLQDYLNRMYCSSKIKTLEFTYGKDPINHIETIALVHPKDQFNRKLGCKIVIGRIKRMRGEIRKPYDPIPEYIYKLEK